MIARAGPVELGYAHRRRWAPVAAGLGLAAGLPVGVAVGLVGALLSGMAIWLLDPVTRTRLRPRDGAILTWTVVCGRIPLTHRSVWGLLDQIGGAGLESASGGTVLWIRMAGGAHRWVCNRWPEDPDEARGLRARVAEVTGQEQLLEPS